MGAVSVGRSRVAIVVALALLSFGLVFAAPAANAAQAGSAAHAGAARVAQGHHSRSAVAPVGGPRVHKLKRRIHRLAAGAGLGQVEELQRNRFLGELRGEGDGAHRVQIRRYDAPANAPPAQHAPHLAMLPRERP